MASRSWKLRLGNKKRSLLQRCVSSHPPVSWRAGCVENTRRLPEGDDLETAAAALKRGRALRRNGLSSWAWGPFRPRGRLGAYMAKAYGGEVENPCDRPLPHLPSRISGRDFLHEGCNGAYLWSCRRNRRDHLHPFDRQRGMPADSEPRKVDKEFAGLNRVPCNPQERPVRVAVSNSFGLGSTKVALVFSTLHDGKRQ
jgi:hypothetical protein